MLKMACNVKNSLHGVLDHRKLESAVVVVELVETRQEGKGQEKSL